MASDTHADPAGPGSSPALTHEQDTARVGADGAGHPAPSVPAPRRRRGLGKAIFYVVLADALVGYIVYRGPERSKEDARWAFGNVYHFIAGPERKLPPPLAEPPSPGKFTGTITVDKARRDALGMQVVTVAAQSTAVQLELTGTTDFDQNTLAKVRPLFDARVTNVIRTTGEMVKKGDPLVELYSTNLAQAKADYRQKYAKWQHDKKLVESRRPLAARELANVTWVDTLIAELTSRVDYLASEDKLATYGIPLDEIKRLQVDFMEEVKVAEGGNDVDKNRAHVGDVQDIAKLVIRAPIDGMIVERDVVSGNFYDDMAVLMVISPMDKLWVWGNVYEKDQSEVHIGQRWDIYFPYLNDMKVEGRVEQISAKVDPGTRTLKIRATIPNPNKQLKAEQLVKAVLQIPVIPGQTVIPRNAMAVINGENCCFVQVPGSPDKFQRKLIEVDQENHDFVVVRAGPAPGEKVVTNGSLILSQLYEDESTVSSGMPLQ